MHGHRVEGREGAGRATGALLGPGELVGEWEPSAWSRGRTALGAGLVGAITLNLLHEAARRFRRDAPRMDLVGKRGIQLVFAERAPRGRALYGTALGGDLLANTLYYGALLLGRPKHPWLRGGLGGLAAGAGAIWLPRTLGLAKRPRRRRGATTMMTMAWYLAGGFAAAAAYRLLGRR